MTGRRLFGVKGVAHEPGPGVDAHHLGELAHVELHGVERPRALGEERGVGGRVRVVHADVDRSAPGGALGEQLREPVEGAGFGSGARDEADIALLELDDGLHLEHLRGPGGDARHAAPAREVLEGVQHDEQRDFRHERLGPRDAGVDVGALARGASRLEHHEPLRHGGVARVQHPHVEVRQLLTGEPGSRDCGVVHGAELRGHGNAEHSPGLRCPGADSAEVLARRRRRRRRKRARRAEQPVELGRVVVHAIDVRPAFEHEVQRDDVDAVLARHVGRDAGGAVGDDGDVVHPARALAGGT